MMGRDIAEQRLKETLRELMAMEDADVPLLLGSRKPQDKCPRGHDYPADPERYPASYKRHNQSRRCTICKVRAKRRQRLHAKIKRYEQVLRESVY